MYLCNKKKSFSELSGQVELKLYRDFIATY